MTSTFVDSLSVGAIDGLEAFHQRRALAFRALQALDREIPRSLPLSAEIRDRTDALLQEILKMDRKLMTALETEKIRIDEQLASNSREKKFVGKFKTGIENKKAGEKFDRTL